MCDSEIPPNELMRVNNLGAWKQIGVSLHLSHKHAIAKSDDAMINHRSEKGIVVISCAFLNLLVDDSHSDSRKCFYKTKYLIKTVTF